MDLKHLVIISVTLLAGISLTLVKPISTQASTWHSSAIPTKLRGHWHATDNHSQGVHIYNHSIHYSGEKTVKVKWRYIGNHVYRFKHGNSYGETIYLKYYNHHKITMNSFWHSYYR